VRGKVKRMKNTETRQRGGSSAKSGLKQWPCRIELVPSEAPYLEGARLMISAACAAFAHPGFHNEFMRDRISLVCCPRTSGDFTDKLCEILTKNRIEDILVVRMEVGCCERTEGCVREALKKSGEGIPARVVTLSTDGKIIKESILN
jgi:hypothetical protein